jgi:hypothetical protein
MREIRRRSLRLGLALVALGLAGLSLVAGPLVGDQAPALPVLELGERPAFPLPAHLEQRDIAAGKLAHAELFEAGRKLFHTAYNGLDGVGMMRTVGGKPLHRFSIGPVGGGQPLPVSAQACGSCHRHPFPGGAGLAHTRVLFDPNQDGEPPFNARGTTSLFGNGVLQRLAEEMTEELLVLRDAAVTAAQASPGVPARRALVAKGVEFGEVVATADAQGAVTFDFAAVRGVSPDLVVRPLGWKGSVVTIRNFAVAAATFGMGMMGEEFVWRLPEEAGPDPDGDGVEREFSVGDFTAITIYNAALETPVEIGRLTEMGLVAPPGREALARVERGRELFARVGCASCHRPEMRLHDTVFEEPTTRGGGRYLDAFLASRDPDYDPARPARFDLLADAKPPRIEPHPDGGAIVRLYGDLKRHDMGRALADPAGPSVPLDASLAPLMAGEEPAFIGAGEFLTPELWGVADTGPWLHDDRAGTLHEAIWWHGEDSPPAIGEPGRSAGQEARDAYLALADGDQQALVTFLTSLRTFSPPRARER